MVLSAMIPSFGEVQAAATKAARGAGLPWGLAEEAGMAARWCWERGLDGVGALAAVLDGYDADACPIRRGAALSDAPGGWAGEVRGAVLLIPFLRGGQLCLRWDGGMAGYDGEAVRMTGVPGLHRTRVEVLDGVADGTPLARRGRRAVDPAAWRVLRRFESRTYAPPSETSRAGAGAGLTDND